MEEEFDLPVIITGQEVLFKASLNIYGHTHKFQVEVNGQPVIFEPDEERNYRAVIGPEASASEHKFDRAVIAAVAAAIENFMK